MSFFMDSCNINFNGTWSQDVGVTNVRIDDKGMNENYFLPNRQIKEFTVNNNNVPYYSGVSYDIPDFNLTLFFQDGVDDELSREVKRWLLVDNYSPLYFEGKEDRIYFVIAHNFGNISYTYINGKYYAYFTVTFRMDSPYAYSPIYDTKYMMFKGADSYFDFENHGDLHLKPKMWIYKIGDGDIIINNRSDTGREFKITNLKDKETVMIDNFNEIIETDIDLLQRYDDFNNGWLNLTRGINRILINGDCKIRFVYRFIYL